MNVGFASTKDTRVELKRKRSTSTILENRLFFMIARLVIVFKNYCLKSVIEIHVFSVYKTKKCVWYHGLNYMFQCSKI